ncbi:MAG TPA: 2TM domain-containing protein [Dehalococcoidia bacterium]|nr:2TM domain-containing protein [Dehalococcoidia bacterium]
MTLADDEGFEGVEFHTPVASFRAGRGGAWADDGDEDYRRARRRVRRLMGFYRHLSTFVTVILGLLVIDIVTGPEDFWVHWVALVWGIILAVHFLNVFIFDQLLGGDAEKRMIDRELQKRQGSPK